MTAQAEPLYDILFPRGYTDMKDSTLIAEGLTKPQAILLRVVSGDLVVHHGTHDLVTEPWWLFGWELDEDRDSYARRAIQHHRGT